MARYASRTLSRNERVAWWIRMTAVKETEKNTRPYGLNDHEHLFFLSLFVCILLSVWLFLFCFLEIDFRFSWITLCPWLFCWKPLTTTPRLLPYGSLLSNIGFFFPIYHNTWKSSIPALSTFSPKFPHPLWFTVYRTNPLIRLKNLVIIPFIFSLFLSFFFLFFFYFSLKYD